MSESSEPQGMTTEIEVPGRIEKSHDGSKLTIQMQTLVFRDGVLIEVSDSRRIEFRPSGYAV